MVSRRCHELRQEGTAWTPARTKDSIPPPTAHRLSAESRFFEDFTPGERFNLPARTMSEAHFLAFQAASGDNHPIHHDRRYCQARDHRDLLAMVTRC